jgi:hypothetical protein
VGHINTDDNMSMVLAQPAPGEQQLMELEVRRDCPLALFGDPLGAQPPYARSVRALSNGVSGMVCPQRVRRKRLLLPVDGASFRLQAGRCRCRCGGYTPRRRS